MTPAPAEPPPPTDPPRTGGGNGRKAVGSAASWPTPSELAAETAGDRSKAPPIRRTASSGLGIEELRVHFGALAAIDGVDLTVAVGEVVCLLGPSGCGKSTLLRAVAGLEQPSAGRITWDGHDLAGVSPHERDVGLVFQDYALFPHLDVAGNVGFGLRMRDWPAARRRARVAEVLGLVGLAGSERRSVGTLSGGEQQRVALARALAPGPRLLLLDEPLGALDRTLRERLVVELAALLTEIGTTALHVTHDQEEAFALGDRIAIMDTGRIAQVGTPAEVWRAPATTSVARFLGFPTVEGRASGGVVTLATRTGDEVRLEMPGVADGVAHVALRPDALRLDPFGPLRGPVTAARFQGDRALLRVATGVGDLEVAVEVDLAPAAGTEVGVAMDKGRVVVLTG